MTLSALVRATCEVERAAGNGQPSPVVVAPPYRSR